MRLHWRKRYNTLGPVATVIGLAFRLRDPLRLRGGKQDYGITCALVLGLSDGRSARPPVTGPLGLYVRRLSRLSAAFALVSDASLAVLGGTLKRREATSGRLADALAWLYLGSAAVKRFWDDGQPEEDLPFLRWSCEHALQRVQESLLGVLDNFPSRATAVALRSLAFPLGARYRPPCDALVAEVARALGEDGEARWRLTADIHVSRPAGAGAGDARGGLPQGVARRAAARAYPRGRAAGSARRRSRRYARRAGARGRCDRRRGGPDHPRGGARPSQSDRGRHVLARRVRVAPARSRRLRRCASPCCPSWRRGGWLGVLEHHATSPSTVVVSSRRQRPGSARA